MSFFGRSRPVRRADGRRRLLGGTAGSWTEQFRIRAAVWPVLIVLGFFVGASVIVLSGEERLAWDLNQRVTQPIMARIAFERVNPTKTAQAQEAVRRSIPNYYRLNTVLLDHVGGELRELRAAVQAADDLAAFEAATRGRWTLDQPAFSYLKSLSDGAWNENYVEPQKKLISRLAQENLIHRPTSEERDPLAQASEDEMLDRGDARKDRVSKQRLSYVTNEQHVVRLAKDLAEIFPALLRKTVAGVLVRSIRVDAARNQYQPVYLFDREQTQVALEAARRLPPEVDKYRPGDVLVPTGIVTPDALELLETEHAAFLAARRALPELYRPWLQKRLGQIGLVLIVTLGLALYTRHYEPRIVHNPLRGTALAGLFLLMLLTARLMSMGHWSSLWALTPTVAAAAILTVAYSQRFAIGAVAIFTILTAMTLRASFELFLLFVIVASLAVYLLDDIRSRMKVIQMGLLTAVAAAVTAGLTAMLQHQALTFAAVQSALAGLATLTAWSLVLVLLPLLERAFGIATSMTLLEWADTSTPLLKQLIQKAPGTWQHSHLLGSMAEAAADGIGANGLLVRIGAYYHDIGKMCKPEYFVENQQSRDNVHSRLPPRMSLLVIVGHVKDGLALAREYGLPPVLFPFITEHHGTTVVRYFHAKEAQKRVRQGEDNGTAEVDETEFRYPGPRPGSKESAILMLADSVEGAVRSLSEPTPGRIESVVHEIAMQRLMDGQLDDCDLTLRELSRVEQSLVKSLCSIYHGRIAYPAAPGAGGAALQTRSA